MSFDLRCVVIPILAALSLSATTAQAQWKATQSFNRLTDQRSAEMNAPIREGPGWSMGIGCASHGFWALAFLTHEPGRKIDGQPRTLLVRIDNGPVSSYAAEVYTTAQQKHAYRTVLAEAHRVRELLEAVGRAKSRITIGFPNWPTTSSSAALNARSSAATVAKGCSSFIPVMPSTGPAK